jgi:hypothetical protein
VAAHHQRQAIAVVRTGAVVIPNAPIGHADCYEVGGVHVCECGTVRMSRESLTEHHDNVRDDQAALAVGRMRTAIQTITLDEITAAYRAAGGAE